MKLLYLVLDGASDGLIERSSLRIARKPNIDEITKRSACGLMYTVGKGYAPESDSAVISILGYDPERYYTGRGPIEAVGSGISLKGFFLALRANFATVDPKTMRIIDRRAGRDLSSEEARELASALDGMEIDGFKITVKASVGHRAVVVIESDVQLSDEISNTDPAYDKVGHISVAKKDFSPYVAECKPLSDKEDARISAKIVNLFTRRAVEILDKHEVNVKRKKEGKLPANALLMRDAGNKLPEFEQIKSKFGRSFGAIAEMPVEIGICKLMGMKEKKVPPPTGDLERDLPSRLSATLELLKEVDVSYVHLKGPDVYGHDGDLAGKVRSIELIDSIFVEGIIREIEEIAVLITSDHATPWTLKAHSDDPVPVALRIPGEKGDGINCFCEKECSRGSLGIIDHGWMLLPMIMRRM
ncbi:MAG: alkaline phosphatase family protein [Candidatus Methanodesulfokora sp.]